MKIRDELSVREVAGEKVVILRGQSVADMTNVLALNASSYYLWDSLQGREFSTQEVARLLGERYRVDDATALRDAKAWIARLAECGVLEKE